MEKHHDWVFGWLVQVRCKAVSPEEVGVAGCLLPSGFTSDDLRFVVPEPDGRWLAPRPGVVRKGFYRISVAKFGAHEPIGSGRDISNRTDA